MFFAVNEEAAAEEFKHGTTFHETTLCLQDIITYLSSWSAFKAIRLFSMPYSPQPHLKTAILRHKMLASIFI